jgi:hypothetical protein
MSSSFPLEAVEKECPREGVKFSARVEEEETRSSRVWFGSTSLNLNDNNLAGQIFWDVGGYIGVIVYYNIYIFKIMLRTRRCSNFCLT